MAKSKKSNQEFDEGWEYVDGEEDGIEEIAVPKYERTKRAKAAQARKEYDRMMEERRLREMLDDEYRY